MIKTFTFADFTLRLESDCPIADSEGFTAFLSDNMPDYTVRIISGPLPDAVGETIAGNRNHRWIKTDNGCCYLSFYKGFMTDEDITYAVFTPADTSGTLYVCHPEGLWDSMLFDALNIPALLLRRECLILHASCIEYNGEAIIFTAPKQTGKSTQAQLWAEHRNAVIVNGDRIALGFKNGRVYAFGTPYRGSSQINLNTSIPVRAFVCLSQAEKNTIERLPFSPAFIGLFEGITIDREIESVTENATDALIRFVNLAPVYHLACTPDERAVEILENTLR